MGSSDPVETTVLGRHLLQARLDAISLANAFFEAESITLERDGDGNPIYHETRFERLVDPASLFESFDLLPDEGKRDVIRVAYGLALRDPERSEPILAHLPPCLDNPNLAFETLKLLEVMFERSQDPLAPDEVHPGLRRSLPLLVREIDREADVETGVRVKSAAVVSYIESIDRSVLVPYLRVFLDPTNRWGNTRDLLPDCSALMSEAPAVSRAVVRQMLVRVVEDGDGDGITAVETLRNLIVAVREAEGSSVLHTALVADVRTALEQARADASERGELRETIDETLGLLDEITAAPNEDRGSGR